MVSVKYSDSIVLLGCIRLPSLFSKQRTLMRTLATMSKNKPAWIANEGTLACAAIGAFPLNGSNGCNQYWAFYWVS